MPFLQVAVHRATNLAASDFSFVGGKSDPYVIVDVDGDERRSPVLSNNLNPVWDPAEKYEFDIPDVTTAVLKVRVYDYDAFNPDDLLGHLVLPVAKFAGQLNTVVRENYELDVPAEFAKQKLNSTIQLEICLRLHDDGEKTFWAWENETWAPTKGWRAAASKDRRHWSSFDETRTSDRFEDVAPPVPTHLESDGWGYSTKSGDQLGWLYASSFKGPWSSNKSATSFARRRLWENVCRPIGEEKQGSAMF